MKKTSESKKKNKHILESSKIKDRNKSFVISHEVAICITNISNVYSSYFLCMSIFVQIWDHGPDFHSFYINIWILVFYALEATQHRPWACYSLFKEYAFSTCCSNHLYILFKKKSLFSLMRKECREYIKA